MQRTKTLTTKTIYIYKSIISILMFMILYFVLKHILVSSNYYLLVNIGMLLYVVFKNILKIKYVEYDNANLYVNHHDYQVQIPF